MKRKRWIWLAAAAMAVGVAIPALDSRLAVRTYEISSEHLTAPVRAALVTDFHSCNYGPGQRELISALEEAAPDLVLLGGDIFDDEGEGANALELVPLLARQWPCYYVTGNHEWWTQRAEEIKTWLRDQGVIVLDGTCLPVEANGQTISLCGVDDPAAGKQLWAAQLEEAAAGRQEGTFSLLLTHRPERVKYYQPYHFDLILAGHSHGGQWRLPGLINGLLTPNQGLFPAYAGGWYDLEGSVMVVSRGLARESTRVPRVFNRPELVVLDLVPNM